MSPRKEQAHKSLQVWTDRLLNGEENPKTDKPYSLDEAPEWIRPRIQENLNRIGGVEEPNASKLSTEEEILDKLEYRQLIKSIPSMTKTKQLKLVNYAKGFEKKGMNQLSAMTEAVKKFRNEDAEFERGLNRGLRAAPPEGDPTMKKKPDALADAKKTGKLFGLTDEDYKVAEKYKSNS